MASSDIAEIRRQAKAVDVDIDAVLAEQLLTLRDLILRYNRKINLIARCTPQEAIERHLTDSLGLCRVLDRRRELAPNARPDIVYDVGSGGGFPGLVLAACYPDVAFHMVEPIAKKVALVAQAARTLGLDNVTTHNARLEAIESPKQPIWAVSRATFHPRDWAKVGREFVGVGGAVIVMVGGAELPDLLEQAHHVDRFALPESRSARVNAVLLG